MIILGFTASKVLNTQFSYLFIDYITINISGQAQVKRYRRVTNKTSGEKVRYIDKVKNTKSTAKEGIAIFFRI